MNPAAQTWTEFSIDEIKARTPNAIAIGPFGSRMKASTYVPQTKDAISVIRGTNISDTKELTGDFVFVNRDTADQLRSSNVYAGDLVFPHRGSIGLVAIVPDGVADRFILSTSLMKLSCNREMCDPEFLFYFFRSPLGQHELLKNASQVGTPGIATPLTSLRSIRVRVPPLPEQRAIAHILGTLDDKIELNRKMNATLDEIARTLFTSWFVDFDPVRAKAEGRQPEGMDAATAALFPDRFVDSELGPIPEGWSVMALDEFGEVLGGGTPKTSEPAYWNGDIPWFSMADLPNPSDVFVIRTKKNITKAGEANSSAKILPANTTILTARGTVGQVALAGVAMAINQSCYGLFPKDGTSTSAMYYWTKASVSLLEQRAHGSVFATITRSTLASIRISVPSERVLRAFESLVAPLLARIRANLLENATLTQVRDALLPQLLSGELARLPSVTSGL